MPLLATAALLMIAAQPPAGAKVDFRRDVYPLLKDNCFACHQGRQASSGIRLDLRAEILGETNGKPLARIGRGADSRLIHMVSGKVAGKIMPKIGPRLTEQQIATLRVWIDQGVAWDDKLLPVLHAQSDHWAFQAIAKPAIPRVKDQAWVSNPIDAFIAAKHEDLRIGPAPPVEPRTLLRRWSFGLTGLPPTAEETAEFVAAWNRAGAKRQAELADRVVNRLLGSPHFGERWGRHWLDVARWAESEGYESNHPRLYAWRYRDWVVRAFNADMPFADFVRAQIAGDEMTPYADDNLIATGFLAAARLSSNEEDRYRQRNDILVDIANTTASALLGLTLQCAQCHSHKFDPISARDYYRFQGFFVQGQPSNVALRDPQLWKDYAAKRPAGYDQALEERDRLFKLAHGRKLDAVRAGLSANAKDALARAMEQRTPAQEKLAREADLLFQFTAGQIENALKPDERKRFNELKKQVAEFEKQMLDKPQTFAFYSPATSPHQVSVLPMKGFYPLPYEPKELARSKPYLLAAGDVHQPAAALDAGWPAVLGAAGKPPAVRSRTALAEWLTSPRNPLTARVYVNRIWQHHFGRGLVATASDFGVKGAAPTHPELLDWLAGEFLRSGGSTKHVHRLIVTSNTYRQSALASRDTVAKDPDNDAWSRWMVRRLEAEAIRDAWLAASGELDRRLGGPSQPADDKGTRRSLYQFQKREAAPLQQALFDGPSAMTESCARRLTTTVPLQALYALNSDFSVRRAQALAKRVLAAAGDNQEPQIDVSFRMALQRLPDDAERRLARQFFGAATHQETSGDVPMALVQWCQALMNVNEFVYVE
ncbi:MAG: PSD1 and planctomycete cytochrome C domain-containing protein [Gemmataceae bacterium]|nr:PSD1 and planctomycete cytochrome C domain-containing protein [Gemmataceae bacterium]